MDGLAAHQRERAGGCDADPQAGERPGAHADGELADVGQRDAGLFARLEHRRHERLGVGTGVVDDDAGDGVTVAGDADGHDVAGVDSHGPGHVSCSLRGSRAPAQRGPMPVR